MIEVIKDNKGNQLKEPEGNYIIETIDGVMYGVNDFREATAAIIGNEYLDCETAETEWLMRLDSAKGIGLNIIANEDNANVILYDERIGKIPYSYTDTNPEYNIPENPELIRVECDETFILTLAKLRFIRLWIKSEDTYNDYLKINNFEEQIVKFLEPFKDKEIVIPLHERI